MTEALLVNTLQAAAEKVDASPALELPKNYSILINRMEKLAIGLDSVLSNLSLGTKAVDVGIGFGSDLVSSEVQQIFDGASLLAAERGHAAHTTLSDEVQLTRVVSDIWIGVILTLLIVSVVFFICSCFLYHKFQQWKNSYRTSHNEAVEICRRYQADFAEAESLPSYTIVSGLPSYDDALEEFRKAGILLTPPTPIIKLFESDTKNSNVIGIEEALSIDSSTHASTAGDSVSMGSTCTCGDSSVFSSRPQAPTPNNSMMNLCLTNGGSVPAQIIELTPEQLATLSRKRLSLQIAFNNSLQRSGRGRVDLYRAANRNNHLRSRFPTIHRSTSTNSLSMGHQRIQQHRGSLG